MHPTPALFALQKPGIHQPLEVVRQGGLRDPQSCRKMTRTGRRVRGVGDQAHQPQPHRVCERLHQDRESFSLLCRHQRIGTGRRAFEDGKDSGHSPILGDIDICRYERLACSDSSLLDGRSDQFGEQCVYPDGNVVAHQTHPLQPVDALLRGIGNHPGLDRGDHARDRADAGLGPEHDDPVGVGKHGAPKPGGNLVGHIGTEFGDRHGREVVHHEVRLGAGRPDLDSPAGEASHDGCRHLGLAGVVDAHEQHTRRPDRPRLRQMFHTPDGNDLDASVAGCTPGRRPACAPIREPGAQGGSVRRML